MRRWRSSKFKKFTWRGNSRIRSFLLADGTDRLILWQTHAVWQARWLRRVGHRRVRVLEARLTIPNDERTLKSHSNKQPKRSIIPPLQKLKEEDGARQQVLRNVQQEVNGVVDLRPHPLQVPNVLAMLLNVLDFPREANLQISFRSDDEKMSILNRALFVVSLAVLANAGKVSSTRCNRTWRGAGRERRDPRRTPPRPDTHSKTEPSRGI